MTQLWYAADPITGQLKEYVEESVEYEAPTEAPAAAESTAPVVVPEPAPAAPLEEDRKRVVLGLAKVGKRAGGIAKRIAQVPAAGFFKAALDETPEDEPKLPEATGKARDRAGRPPERAEPDATGATAEAKRVGADAGSRRLAGGGGGVGSGGGSGGEALGEEPPQEVDWENLICFVCKRKLKDRNLLRKHVEESELHKTNLDAWRQQLAEHTRAPPPPSPRDERRTERQGARGGHRGRYRGGYPGEDGGGERTCGRDDRPEWGDGARPPPPPPGRRRASGRGDEDGIDPYGGFGRS